MTERLKFPDEPIRVGAGDAVTPRELTPEERAEEAVWDEYADMDDHGCMSCEDGWTWCDGNDLMCPEADDSGCYMHHAYRCTNCGGSGLSKDQRFW
jgi:hypothetical protein